MKRIFALMLALVLALSVLPMGTEAAGQTRLPEKPLLKADASPLNMQETEPNSSIATADNLGSSYVMVSGMLSAYDLDYFRFVLTEESTLVALNMATYTGIALCVMDASDKVVDIAMDAGTIEGYPTAYLETTLPAGTYYFLVMDQDNHGDGVYVFTAEITPTGHTHTWDEGQVTQAPTCDKEGTKEFRCAGCSEVKTETLPKTEHSFGEWETTLAPTTTTAGEETRTCAGCGAAETREVEPLPDGGEEPTPDPEPDPEPEIYSGTFGYFGTWRIENGVFTVSGATVVPDMEEGQAPWNAYLSKIRKVTIPEGFTKLGNNAFADAVNLKEVSLPSTLTTIGNQTFRGCRMLEAIDIPRSVTAIGNMAFADCASLVSIVVAENWSDVGTGCFKGCTSLSQVTIENGFSTIPDEFLANCTALTELIIPDVYRIKSKCFTGSGLKVIHFLDNCNYISSNAFEGVTATVYYFASGWDSWDLDDYGGTLTWVEVSPTSDIPTNPGYCTFIKESGKHTTPSAALSLTEGKGYEGYISKISSGCEADFYKVTLSAAKEMTVLAEFGAKGGVLRVYAADGKTLLASSDQSYKKGTTTKYAVFLTVSLEAGTYYVEANRTYHDFYNSYNIQMWTTAACQHSFGKPVVTPSTCIKRGSKVSTCSGCGETQTEWLPLVDHSYSAWFVDEVATTEHDGQISKVCLVCDHMITKVIPKLEKDYGMLNGTVAWSFNNGVLTLGGAGEAVWGDEPPIWLGYYDRVHTIVVKEGITAIGREAFAGFNKATSVSLPSTLKSIGALAFQGTPKLKEILIPASVRFIDAGAFFYSGVQLVRFAGPAPEFVGWESMQTFTGVRGRVFYPASDASWTQSLRESLGGDMTWVAVGDPANQPSFVNPFKDLHEGDRFYEPIRWAYTQGITQGKTKDEFQLKASCTRSQVVTFLWRAAGEPEPKSMVSPFTDVQNTGAYYYKAVLWAVEQGITTGKTATTFMPNDTVKREQFVTFLWRAAGQPEVKVGSPFTDVTNTGAYYYKAVIWAVNQGITNGTGKAVFGVGKDCNRSQTVMFLYRYYEDQPVTDPAGIALNKTSVLLADKLHTGITLSGTVLPAHATNKTITYTSTNPDVVRVDSNGKLTPVGPGTATIVAKCGSAEAYCTVTYNAYQYGGYLSGALAHVKDYLGFKLIDMYAGSYINSDGEECIISIIRYQAINILGNKITDTYLSCYNVTQGKTIRDPYEYYTKQAETLWGQNRIRAMERANEYLGLEIAFKDFTQYYIDSYGIIRKK